MRIAPDILAVILIILLTIFAISYFHNYDINRGKQLITEMVKPEALKGN